MEKTPPQLRRRLFDCFSLLDLEHLHHFHRQVQVASQFDLALHEGLHPIQFAGEDLDVISRISGEGHVRVTDERLAPLRFPSLMAAFHSPASAPVNLNWMTAFNLQLFRGGMHRAFFP